MVSGQVYLIGLSWERRASSRLVSHPGGGEGSRKLQYFAGVAVGVFDNCCADVLVERCIQFPTFHALLAYLRRIPTIARYSFDFAFK